MDVEPTSRLDHPTLSRPRPRRNHRVTRPNITTKVYGLQNAATTRSSSRSQLSFKREKKKKWLANRMLRQIANPMYTEITEDRKSQEMTAAELEGEITETSQLEEKQEETMKSIGITRNGQRGINMRTEESALDIPKDKDVSGVYIQPRRGAKSLVIVPAKDNYERWPNNRVQIIGEGTPNRRPKSFSLCFSDRDYPKLNLNESTTFEEITASDSNTAHYNEFEGEKAKTDLTTRNRSPTLQEEMETLSSSVNKLSLLTEHGSENGREVMLQNDIVNIEDNAGLRDNVMLKDSVHDKSRDIGNVQSRTATDSVHYRCETNEKGGGREPLLGDMTKGRASVEEYAYSVLIDNIKHNPRLRRSLSMILNAASPSASGRVQCDKIYERQFPQLRKEPTERRFKSNSFLLPSSAREALNLEIQPLKLHQLRKYGSYSRWPTEDMNYSGDSDSSEVIIKRKKSFRKIKKICDREKKTPPKKPLRKCRVSPESSGQSRDMSPIHQELRVNLQPTRDTITEPQQWGQALHEIKEDTSTMDRELKNKILEFSPGKPKEGKWSKIKNSLKRSTTFSSASLMDITEEVPTVFNGKGTKFTITVTSDKEQASRNIETEALTPNPQKPLGTGIRSQERLSLHNELLDVYCTKCRIVICEKCTAVSHQDETHRTLFYTDALSLLRTEVVGLQRHYSLLQSSIDSLINVYAKFSKHNPRMKVIEEAQAIIDESKNLKAIRQKIQEWEERQHDWGPIVYLAIRCRLLRNINASNDKFYIRINDWLLPTPWIHLSHLLQPYLENSPRDSTRNSNLGEKDENIPNHSTITTQSQFDENLTGRERTGQEINVNRNSKLKRSEIIDKREPFSFPKNSRNLLLHSLIPYIIFNPDIRYFIHITNSTDTDITLVVAPSMEHVDHYLKRQRHTAAYSPRTLRLQGLTPAEDSFSIVEKQMMMGGKKKSRLVASYMNISANPASPSTPTLVKIGFQNIELASGGLGLAAATGGISKGDLIVDSQSSANLSVVVRDLGNFPALRLGRVVQGMDGLNCLMVREERRRSDTSAGIKAKIRASIMREEETNFEITFGIDI
ncbi:hypothetical protein SK128_028617 [Halocaridina rubra]|uniref:Uncharacterized protein n=1 Tax=Halocaridina rubra TaxID=373956 RepID=A0AAN8WRG9_HALRR